MNDQEITEAIPQEKTGCSDPEDAVKKEQRFFLLQHQRRRMADRKTDAAIGERMQRLRRRKRRQHLLRFFRDNRGRSLLLLTVDFNDDDFIYAAISPRLHFLFAAAVFMRESFEGNFLQVRSAEMQMQRCSRYGTGVKEQQQQNGCAFHCKANITRTAPTGK